MDTVYADILQFRLTIPIRQELQAHLTLIHTGGSKITSPNGINVILKNWRVTKARADYFVNKI